MPKCDHATIAVYAAGIASSFGCVESGNAEEVARFERVVEEHGGHVGIMQEVAKAAVAMERFRVSHGKAAKWGEELPYLYDVWDAIATAIWLRLGREPLDGLVEAAIRATESVDAAQRENQHLKMM